jgi:hypothetical protein
MNSDTEFGFLTRSLSLASDRIGIVPKDDYVVNLAQFTGDLHTDGFFYPSSTHTVAFPNWPDMTRQERVPNTGRPAQLFTLPASHTLSIKGPIGDEPARDDASFIVQVLAYLFGTRLQVAGWQFDGRIPVRHSTHHTWIGQAALERFVPQAYEEWRSQNANGRLRLTNILYMHCKASSYEWPWERFFVEYLVTDALFDYCYRTTLTTRVTHGERLKEMCGRLGVWCPAEAPIEALVDMRNSLFHEALWDGERPGYRTGEDSYYKVFELRTLNQRLIAALLGGATPYTGIPWTAWRERTLFE